MDRYRALLVSLVLGAAIVISTSMVAKAAVQVFRIRHQNHMLTVTGSAKRRIQSDLIIWRASVQSRAPDLASAYKTLSVDVPKVVEFIRSKGIDPKEIVVSAAHTTELHPHDKEGHEITETVVAYSMEQSVQVTSHDIDKVTAASQEATKLIEDGIYVGSEAPRYLYTKLAELKIQMLAEASKDARVRAEQMAVNMGSSVSSLQSARMGVMQINAANESEVSAEGNNDTSSLDKDIMAVVTAAFGVGER
jgi:uncharacterized protein